MNILKQKSIRNQLLNKRKESLNSFSPIEHRLDFFSNKLEKIWENYIKKDFDKATLTLNEIISYHQDICIDLKLDKNQKFILLPFFNIFNVLIICLKVK